MKKLNMNKKYLAAIGAAAMAAPVGSVEAQTTQDPMMDGRNGAVLTPLITVGETVTNANGGGDYQFVGIPDGLGAFELDDDTVRVYMNHEFNQSVGGSWNLANGTTVSSGARVSFFDIDKNTRQVTQGGLAIDSVVDAGGNTINGGTFAGFARYCSSAMFGTAEGFTGNIYFMGEETSGGREYAIDTTTGTAYELDWGKAAWENITVIPTAGTEHADKSVFLIGDDRGDAPALLYVGEKDAGSSDFLRQNGLVGGSLYAWVSDDGDAGPKDFNGTGNSRTGQWVGIDNTGSGDFGLATQEELDSRYEAAGAFKFSRPEDVAYDPISFNQGRAVMASTGRSTDTSDDLWGTLYEFNVDLDSLDDTTITGSVSILNDGREEEDLGIRSPDNLDWADDGLVYINEDRSIGGFGDVSGRDALIWQFDPASGAKQILAEMAPYIAEGFVDDGGLDDLGDWESSGILDVSNLFGEDAGSLFLTDVQAHSLTPDPAQPAFADTVQGGQLLFLDVSSVSPVPEPSTAGLLIGLSALALTKRRQG